MFSVLNSFLATIGNAAKLLTPPAPTGKISTLFPSGTPNEPSHSVSATGSINNSTSPAWKCFDGFEEAYYSAANGYTAAGWLAKTGSIIYDFGAPVTLNRLRWTCWGSNKSNASYANTTPIKLWINYSNNGVDFSEIFSDLSLPSYPSLIPTDAYTGTDWIINDFTTTEARYWEAAYESNGLSAIGTKLSVFEIEWWNNE